MIGVLLACLVLVALILVLTGVVMLARGIMMPSRPVTLTVNGTNRIATETGRKLLSVLTDNGVLIPSACAGAGTCGLCRVQITGDAPAPLPVEVARMSRSDLRAGVHLACQVTLRDDMEVRVQDDLLAADSYDCRVASVTALTPLIREIVLELPEGHHADLFAGAFVQITTPPFALTYADIEVPQAYQADWTPLRGLSVAAQAPVTRAYSIANRPEDTRSGRIVLNIRLALPPPSVAGAPPGVVSSWLFALRPGEVVSVAGPFGTFRVQENDRELVFLGGGVGMAPLRAMIFDALENKASSRRMSFWFGARSLSDLFYREELDALAAQHRNFNWTVALSDPDPGDNWSGPTGFIHTVVWERYLRDHPAPEDCDYYLCGPPMMIAAVLRMLDDLGVDPDHIFNDDFGV